MQIKQLTKQIYEHYRKFCNTHIDMYGYVDCLQDNLFASAPIDLVIKDYIEGQGHELDHKMKAVHSSSALVVNTFGPFRQSPISLNILGYTGFETLKFEAKCPTGLRGTVPHLDLLLRGNDHVIGIESKYTETAECTRPKFSDSYSISNLPFAEKCWMCALEYYKSCDRLLYFDVAQIIKHYLGLRRSFSKISKKITLIYLFWEPVNSKNLNSYIVHREEIDEFTEKIKESEVDFIALSYSELWNSWKHQTSVMLHEHVQELEDRYKIAIVG